MQNSRDIGVPIYMKMLMHNTIWLFGCSFTDANTLESVLDYRGSVKQHSKYLHWGDYLLSYFNSLGDTKYRLKNFGLTGLSMKFIMYSLLNVLDKIQPGDIVIVGNTTGDRIGYLKEFNPEQDKLQIDLFNVWSWDSGDKGNLILSKDTHTEELSDIMGVHYDAINSRSLYDYPALSYEEKLNNKIMHSVLKILSKQDIKTFMWDFSIWQAVFNGMGNNNPHISIFETIEAWTGWEVNDRHWSPNGNRVVADFFIWCIKNNYTYFAYQYIPDFWKDYTEEPDKYINYFELDRKS